MTRTRPTKPDRKPDQAVPSTEHQESQSDTWLREQIRAALGEQGQALIQSAHAHGVRASIWLCEQMAVRGYPTLAEAYQSRKGEEAAALPYEREGHTDG